MVKAKVKKLTKGLSPSILKNSAVFFLAGNFVNVLNYLFHIVTSRMMNVEEYGVLSSLLALFFILSVPSLTFQTVVARQVSEYKGKQRQEFTQFLFLEMLLFGVGVTLMFLIFAPQIGAFLHIDDMLLLYSLGATFGITFLLSAYRGYFQGVSSFGLLSVNMITESALKLMFFMLFFVLGLSVFSAMWAIFFSIFCAIVFFHHRMPRAAKNVIAHFKSLFRSTFWKESLIIFWSLLFITLFYNVDLLIVRHFLPESTGEYSILSKLGQLLFFGCQLVISVFFSHVVSSKKGDSEMKETLFIMGAIFAFGTMANIMFFFFGKEIVNLVFGDQYVGAAPYLWMYGVAITFLSFTNFISHYYMARKEYKFLYIVGGVFLAYVASLWAFHESLQQILLCTVVSQGCLFVAMFLFKFFPLMKRRFQKISA